MSEQQRQVVIVTGASRGLGAAAARILASMGAQVVLTARSAVPLDDQVDTIRSLGGDAIALAGDITDPVTSKRLVRAALEQFGRLDAIVNNAGVLKPLARIGESDPDAWRRALDINLIGPLLLTREALPHLREVNGRVINVSSGAAVKTTVGWGAYSASKAALNHFNATLAHEEMTVTAIAMRPGKVDTMMQGLIRAEGAQTMEDERHAYFVDAHEHGDLLPPEKPGRALALLALRADPSWSGEFMSWDDERVAQLDV